MTRRMPVHDFLVATSERRRELRGERWDSLRLGVASSFPLAPEMDRTRLHPRFEKGVTFASREAVAYDVPEPRADVAGDALTAAEKLSLVLRHSAWPIRWEPLNTSGQHRAVGTPGALFPVDLYLLARTRRGARALHCSPRDLCLLETAELSGDAARETADALSLVVVGNLGRCVGIYGDLALWLVALEAGMLHAQIRLVARTVGWRIDDIVDDVAATRALLGIAHWSELPLIRCRVSGAASATANLAERRLRTIRPLPHHAAADAHPLMRQFVELVADPRSTSSGPGNERVAPNDSDDTDDRAFPILETSRLRSSGLGGGIVRWTRDLTAEVRDAVLADTRRLLRDSRGAGASTPLAVSLVWRPTRAGTVQIYDVDMSQARMTDVPASREALDAALGMCRYNAGLLVTIGADGNAIAAAGARAVVDTYLHAGALAQCFSLAATRNGLAARLFMAYPDEMKNLLMPLTGRVLVQILIGYDTRPNPAFPIA